jgi:HEAT repeat protein
MTHLSDELRLAFDSDDAQQLGRLIRQRRKADFEALTDLLSDPLVSSEYRMKALTALGRWGDRTVIPVMREILPQLNERERIAAIDALGRLGTAEAEVAVSAYVDDESPQVRKFVILALDHIGTAEAKEKLSRIARQDQDAWIRQLAVGRLGEGGGQS